LDFCVLLGTDASPRIPGIGPVKARKLIEKYGSIEAILANESKVAKAVDENLVGFMDQVRAARKVFGELPPIPEGITLEQGVWNEEVVEEWLKANHGIQFSEDLEPVESEDEYELDPDDELTHIVDKMGQLAGTESRQRLVDHDGMDEWMESQSGNAKMRGDEYPA